MLARMSGEIDSLGLDTSAVGIATGAALHTLAAAITELQCRGEASAANLIREQFAQKLAEIKTQNQARATRRSRRVRRSESCP
jgi:hypothetical protein